MLTVGVIGLGLIGGSLAMALKAKSGIECYIAGLDSDQLTLERAQVMGIIDNIIVNWDVSACDMVFICSPIPAIPMVLGKISSTLKPGAIVTDVGSVKSPVMNWFASMLPAGVTGIGGHPMAGSDKSGISAADNHLFENAVWVLTPPPEAGTVKLAALTCLLAATGASIRVMDAARHDEAVSRVSHLPHLTAVCLVNALQDNEESLGLAGGGFRDTTRIASSQSGLWADILLSNRDKVIDSIDALVEKLAAIRHTLNSGQRAALVAQLQAAKEVRDQLPQRRESLRQAVDVIAMVPDQPGIIGRLGRLLGDAGININDMQVLGVRDEDEGSLRLAIPEKQAQQAAALLSAAGIRAWVRD